MKTCNNCKESKPICDFHSNGMGGTKPICKECRNRKKQEVYTEKKKDRNLPPNRAMITVPADLHNLTVNQISQGVRTFVLSNMASELCKCAANIEIKCKLFIETIQCRIHSIGNVLSIMRKSDITVDSYTSFNNYEPFDDGDINFGWPEPIDWSRRITGIQILDSNDHELLNITLENVAPYIKNLGTIAKCKHNDRLCVHWQTHLNTNTILAFYYHMAQNYKIRGCYLPGLE